MTDKITFVTIIIFISFSSIFCSAELIVDTRVAKKIAKEKGILQPFETFQWQKLPKNIPEDWTKIDNKYFNVSYPKCFTLEGDGGEDDPKIAPGIVLKREKNCPYFKENYGNSNFFTIGYFPTAGIKNLHWSHGHENQLFRQKGKINNIDSILIGSLMDEYNFNLKKHEAQFRWEIFLICNQKPFRIVYDLPPGKHTMDLINNNRHEFPEDFKEIVSTFHCK